MRKKTKIGIIVTSAFLLYCIIMFIKLVANPIDTFIVEQGKIYKEEAQIGYIIRDEQVIENESNSRKYCTTKK